MTAAALELQRRPWINEVPVVLIRVFISNIKLLFIFFLINSSYSLKDTRSRCCCRRTKDDCCVGSSNIILRSVKRIKSQVQGFFFFFNSLNIFSNKKQMEEAYFFLLSALRQTGCSLLCCRSSCHGNKRCCPGFAVWFFSDNDCDELSGLFFFFSPLLSPVLRGRSLILCCHSSVQSRSWTCSWWRGVVPDVTLWAGDDVQNILGRPCLLRRTLFVPDVLRSSCPCWWLQEAILKYRSNTEGGKSADWELRGFFSFSFFSPWNLFQGRSGPILSFQFH